MITTGIPDPFFAVANVVFISPLTTDEGDRNMLLMQTGDNTLWLTRASTTVMTPPVQVGRLGGTLSVQTTEKGSEIF